MAEKIDFFVFYEDLGLPPHFDSDDLKQAFRRRVSELHPDRRLHGDASVGDIERLQALTAAYNAARTFQRRYGRLPGAQSANSPAAARWDHHAHTPAQPAPRHFSVRRLAFAALLLAALAWLVLGNTSISNVEKTKAAPAQSSMVTPSSTPITSPTSAPVQQLHIGMDREMARSIQGIPLMENGEQWTYGPSWIQFDHGRIVDWYSSRLRPLKVATMSPIPETTQDH